MIYYYEYYPHYMAGDMTAEVKMSDEDFNHLLYLATEYHKSNDRETLSSVIDELEACLEAIEKDNDVSLYALDAALLNSKRHMNKIMREMNNTGIWAGDWEEGSHGFSMNSLKEAKKAVGKVEAKHVLDDFDW